MKSQEEKENKLGFLEKKEKEEKEAFGKEWVWNFLYIKAEG